MKRIVYGLVIGIGMVLFECRLGLAIEGTATEGSKIEPQKVSIIG